MRAIAAAHPQMRSSYEVEYEQVLHLRQAAGEIVEYRYEPIRLILGDRVTYTPDFLVVLPNGELELHEVKGRMMEKARVKLRSSARAFPWFRFILVTKAPKKLGGGWNFETIPI